VQLLGSKNNDEGGNNNNYAPQQSYRNNAAPANTTPAPDMAEMADDLPF